MRKTTLCFTDARVPDQAGWLDLPGCGLSSASPGVSAFDHQPPSRLPAQPYGLYRIYFIAAANTAAAMCQGREGQQGRQHGMGGARVPGTLLRHRPRNAGSHDRHRCPGAEAGGLQLWW